MSFLFKPVTPGSILAGTAVDPLGPGGVLIEIPTEVVQVPGPPLPAGTALLADGAGSFVMAPVATDNRFGIQFAHGSGIPAGGTRYLRFGTGVISSSAGFRMSAAGTLRGITIQVDSIDAAQTFDIEVLIDPAGRLGAPTVIGTLSLPTSTLFAIDRTFAVAVTTTDELGVRVVRTAGAAASAFTDMAVKTEWSIP